MLTNVSSSNHNLELTYAKQIAQQHNREIGYEKHRTSTDSSSTFSSSSFSSVDHNTSSKPSRTSSRRHSFAESLPQAIPVKHLESPIPLGRQSLDLQDVVEDAMHKETRGFSIKMVPKKEGNNNVLKHIDFPRPLASVAGADGSTQSLAKYPEAPRIAKEETSDKQKLKDAPRFSYDSIELQDATRSSIKLKEFPKLSLDDRDTRGGQRSDLAPTSLPSDSEERGVYSQTHGPSSNKRSTVISKLIGLEPFSDHPLADQSKMTASDRDSISRSSLSEDLNRRNNIPLSLRLQKDPISPEPSRTNFRKKTTANSRLPEQAPFRQQNANRELQKSVGKNKKDLAKGSHASSTIYFQIGKRDTDLEFKGSGKNLRALKQILETMHKTRMGVDQKEVNLESQTRGCSLEYSSCNQHIRSLIKSYEEKTSKVTTMKSSSSQKPQILVDKSSPTISAVAFPQFRTLHVQNSNSKGVDSVHKQMGREQRPVRSNSQQPRRLSPRQEKKIKGKLPNTLHLSKETGCKKEQNFTLPTKSLGTMSRQTRHNKHVLEKKNHNSPSSGFCMARAQLSSPNRKSKVKSSYQQSEERKHTLHTNLRDSFHEDDTASLITERKYSSAFQVDTYFTSTYSYENGCKQQGGYKNEDLEVRLRNKSPKAELVIPTAEQPSPISVLDASIYREDSPSPVKKISTPSTDDHSPNANEAEWSSEILDHLQETRVPNLSVELFDKRMKDIRSLVHKLDQLNRVPHESTTNHIESLSNNTNQDHCYITKILLASGLLKDTSLPSNSIQLYSNGQMINPKLFHVLEQTEGQNDFSGKTIQTKMDRKILFDAVNEILAQKLDSEKSIPLSLRSGNSFNLLKEIHMEVERLRKLSYSSNVEENNHDQVMISIFGADMDHQTEGWKDFRGELPSLVLDVERLIFKDLITNFINDVITSQQDQYKHSKKDFNN
ncbi:hypothetical protein Leryth_012832 [Lithospermum erythrorhizon]|nr:hypothetical protein Leryth_012832 [Lithospermum erythrorhizon]